MILLFLVDLLQGHKGGEMVLEVVVGLVVLRFMGGQLPLFLRQGNRHAPFVRRPDGDIATGTVDDTHEDPVVSNSSNGRVQQRGDIPAVVVRERGPQYFRSPRNPF